MVLFWNPGCGFCRKMVDELKEWEANPPKGAPRLLVVSTGTVEANQALGLQSTTVLDEGFQRWPRIRRQRDTVSSAGRCQGPARLGRVRWRAKA